jgi:single-strand DNA-binding protein
LNFSAANNIGFGDKKTTLWLEVVLFGKRAESNFVQLLTKGQSVFLSGEISQSTYEAKDGSGIKTKLQLVANIVELAGSSEKHEPTTKNKQKDHESELSYPMFSDSDIPF